MSVQIKGFTPDIKAKKGNYKIYCPKPSAFLYHKGATFIDREDEQKQGFVAVIASAPRPAPALDFALPKCLPIGRNLHVAIPYKIASWNLSRFFIGTRNDKSVYLCNKVAYFDVKPRRGEIIIENNQKQTVPTPTG